MRAVVTEPIDDAGFEILASVPGLSVMRFGFDAPSGEISGAIASPETVAILVRTFALDASVLDGAPNLRIVAKHGVGCDNIDLAALSGRGIPVANTPGANAAAVAEHTMLLLLASARRLAEQTCAARAADWSFRGGFAANGLEGRRLLLVGTGRIAARVGTVARALGMHVSGYSPSGRMDDGIVPVVDLDTALGDADFVSLHLPLSGATRGMFDAARIARMRPGAILVNTARGGIVAEKPLIAALRSGHLGAYGTDVFATEPLVPDDPLLSMPNVVATPHLAAISDGSARAMAAGAAGHIRDALGGCLDMSCVVNGPFKS